MPKGPQGQKRPTDVIGNAVTIMQIATGQQSEDSQLSGKEHGCRSAWPIRWRSPSRKSYREEANGDCKEGSEYSLGEAMSSVFVQLQKEVGQTHDLRKPLLQRIKKLRGDSAVVSFFNRFYGNYPLSHPDADMVEEVLCNTDCSKGVTLILDAPGGDGLAAERIIQICRSYSGNGVFETIVPARAKSAATMVCLGSDKILLSPTSELGPIDPQIYRDIGAGRNTWVAADHFIKSYDKMFTEAVALTAGHIEPYLQQLGKFNVVDIQDLKAAQQLSIKIAVSSLKKGMLKAKTEQEIEALIKPFTDPAVTLSHGRALNHENCTTCELNVEVMSLKSPIWKTVWDLYMRSKFVVESTNICKLVESVNSSCSMTGSS